MTVHQTDKKFVLCPVSKLDGFEHFYEHGTGVKVFWDEMGDPCDEKVVCPACAQDSFDPI